MPEESSTLRLYLLRLTYLLNFAFLGMDVWPAIIRHSGPWEPMKGVAYCFWAALATLSLLGIRYPLRMLPLLLMQFSYKAIWFFAVALPQWSAVRSTALSKAMVIGRIVDLIIIPWPYVFANLVKNRGDRWK